MKALVLHNPQEFSVRDDWPKPQAKEGWCVVKVKYSGICGSDLPRMMLTGSYDHPKICGHEFMGYIEEPAPGSKKFKRGDRVAVLPLIPCKKCAQCEAGHYFHCNGYNFIGSRTHGGFAEFCLTPEENLFHVPDGIDERIGDFMEPIMVALHTVRRSGFKKGENAVVFGAGNIGILTAMWLRNLGAERVAIVSRSENSIVTARACGFKHVIKAVDGNFDQYKDFDHCFEAAGSTEALIHAIEKVKRRGTITVIGRDTKEMNIPLKIFEQFMRKEVVLKGCWGYEPAEKEILQEKIG